MLGRCKIGLGWRDILGIGLEITGGVICRMLSLVLECISPVSNSILAICSKTKADIVRLLF